MNNNAKIETKNHSTLLAVTKGIFWAISLSLLCVLIFAFVIKYTSISETAIQPINQVIKGLSILLACFIISKGIKSNGWFWVLIIGSFYTIVSFAIFSILDGEFNFTINLLNDILFGGIMGAIAGILTISLRK